MVVVFVLPINLSESVFERWVKSNSQCFPEGGVCMKLSFKREGFESRGITSVTYVSLVQSVNLLSVREPRPVR